MAYGRMGEKEGIRPETLEIFRRLDALGVKQKELAAYIEIDEDKISKVRNGTRQFRGQELLKALEWLDRVELGEGYHEQSDHPDVDGDDGYVPIEVLPTYAGMGGGGVDMGVYPLSIRESGLQSVIRYSA